MKNAISRRGFVLGAAAAAAGGCRTFESNADRLAGIKAEKIKELFGGVVPFWIRHSIDREFGGYLTCLERDGTPYDTFKQMWMQWREVWMFARLARSPHGGARLLPYAEKE